MARWDYDSLTDQHKELIRIGYEVGYERGWAAGAEKGSEFTPAQERVFLKVLQRKLDGPAIAGGGR